MLKIFLKNEEKNFKISYLFGKKKYFLKKPPGGVKLKAYKNKNFKIKKLIGIWREIKKFFLFWTNAKKKVLWKNFLEKKKKFKN